MAATAITSPLSEAEQQRLVEYENQVESGLTALWHIQTENLWREYESFAAYFAARWNQGSRRRRNQIMASMRVYLTLQEQLGTGVPINATEFGLRPLVGVAESSPALAAEIYQEAVDLAAGAVPSHSELELAKKLHLTPEVVQQADIVAQLQGMGRYAYLIQEIRAGSDAVKLLALALALQSCDDWVRTIFIYHDVRDLALIRLLNDDYVRGSETAKDVLQSGYLQCEYFNLSLSQASAARYRQLKDIAYREHQLRQRDQRRGEPVSVVVFYGDPEGTLESLKEVLAYSELIRLGDLLGRL